MKWLFDTWFVKYFSLPCELLLEQMPILSPVIQVSCCGPIWDLSLISSLEQEVNENVSVFCGKEQIISEIRYIFRN
jgi:hypothetical protein